VVPRNGSPVAAFEDLARAGIKLVLAAKEVPIGRYSREILAKASASDGISPDFSAKVLANLKSDEANVRGVLTKVQLGEADAGIVYRTDVGAAAGEVKAIEIPAQYNVVAEYPIAVVSGSKNKPVADAFVTFVQSSGGAAILEKYGFAKP
jgi:molybdate transport system substrate-binding protein